MSSIAFMVGIYSIIEILVDGHFRTGMVGCYILGYYTAVFVKLSGLKSLQYCFWLSLIPTIISNYLYCHLLYIQGIEMKGLLVHITDYSHAFLGYCITTLLMIVFKNFSSNKVIRFSDKYSYEIYLVHQLFILSPLTILTLTNSNSFNVILTVMIILSAGLTLQRINSIIQSKL